MPPILNSATFNFLDVVAEENTREFFATVKPLYEEILWSVTELCQYLIDQADIQQSDGSALNPKDCLFRIYRDARRLKQWDQLYKHHFSFFISPEGKKTMMLGYYVHIEPWNSFFASGIHSASASYLMPLRKKFECYGDEYLVLTQNKHFKKSFGAVHGNALTRPPKGFTIESKHLDLIMKKQHLIMKKYSDDIVLWEQFATQVLKDIAIAQPWSDWLNEI